jgi:hypothetical protein
MVLTMSADATGVASAAGFGPLGPPFVIHMARSVEHLKPSGFKTARPERIPATSIAWNYFSSRTKVRAFLRAFALETG